jgi:hypothetical protein
MFSHVDDNGAMADYEHLLKSYDVADLLDEISSSDPPAYLRRCFAEGCSAPSLSWRRIQQLAACAMLLDAIVDQREYPCFEHELISDWRAHYAGPCFKLKDAAVLALRRVLDRERPQDADAATELEQLTSGLAA